MDRKSPSTRMDAVQTPIIPTIGALVRATPGCISLGQGVVHYPPPRAALDAAARAVLEPRTSQYQPAAGISELLERITAKLSAENGIELGRGSRVMVTAGGNMAFCHALDAITQPGDEIILNTPYYFNHEMAIRIAGCVPVCVPTDERYQPRLDALRAAITDRTRAIVTVTPNNPTGAVYPEATLRAINALCGERGIYHVCDEPYEYFTYGGARHFSAGSIAGAEKQTLSLFSLSKAFGFAGWRTGYMVYPEHLEGAMLKIQDTVLICPPVATQVAAAACLEAGRAYAEPYLKNLAEVRGIVLERLAGLGEKVIVPPAEGAFYCFVKIDSEKDPM
jgi:aspartate/methionine/tyrosine aminotransferase